jgi:hypothetical protein
MLAAMLTLSASSLLRLKEEPEERTCSRFFRTVPVKGSDMLGEDKIYCRLDGFKVARTFFVLF